MAPAVIPANGACRVCGETGHPYTNHMKEVDIPPFVGTAVADLRKLEMSHSHIDGLIGSVQVLVEGNAGGKKAWAIWLLILLEELEDAADAPDVAAEIEDYLLGAYSKRIE
ncbi:MAG: hypothetical protein U9N56_01145 [Actinomycetota bacterium]|nr:hypothetical protein [Actinomycetota bacterium]